MIRLPGGSCVKCKITAAAVGSAHCRPCDDFILGIGDPCMRCGVLPQTNERPWCVRCAHLIDTFDKEDPRGLDEL